MTLDLSKIERVRTPSGGGGDGGDADTLEGLAAADFVRATGEVAQGITGVKVFTSPVTLRTESTYTVPFDGALDLAMQQTDPTDGNTYEFGWYDASGTIVAGMAATFNDHDAHTGTVRWYTRDGGGFANRFTIGGTITVNTPAVFTSYVAIGTSPASTGDVRLPSASSIQTASGNYVEFTTTTTYVNAPSEVTIRTGGSTRIACSSNLVNIPGQEFRLGHSSPFINFHASGVTVAPTAGSPEGVVTAPVGSIRTRTDGGPETALYLKGAGTGNTGWVAVATRVSVPGGPTDYGYKTWSYDPVGAVNSTAPASGALHVVRLECRQAENWTGLSVGVVSVAGLSLTAGQCFMALYNSSGTRVGVTADLSGTLASVGEFEANFTSPVAATPGFYWAAIVLNGTTPTLARAQGQIPELGQGELTASTARFGRAATGQTSAPATITPASINTGVLSNFWVAAR